MDQERISIAGAGIGGLALAVALERRGARAHVFERATALAPVGAGITIQPNAAVLLDSLGLGERVRSAGAILTEGYIRRADGRILSSVHAEGPSQQIVGIHRADLHRILREAFHGEVTLGFGAAGYAQDDAGVTLRAADGREARGAVLVGADGIRSAIRAQMLGDGEPTYAGYTSFRGVCEGTGVDWPAHATSETWGPGRRFGIVPIGGGRLYWFATLNTPPGGTEAGLELLHEAFAGFHAPIGQVLRATQPSAVVRTDIADREPVGRWSDGRVTLLGDAAHPMTPNMGQGGCQAIEDAFVLAEALAREGAPSAAFAAYERIRRARAERFVRWSRSIGRAGQIESGVGRALRDLALRTTPKWVLERRMKEVFTPAALDPVDGLTPAATAG